MNFLDFQEGTYNLGWRFTQTIPPDVLTALEDFMPMSELLTRFSKKRSVALKAFSISRNCLHVNEIISEEECLLEEVQTLDQVCDIIDNVLEHRGWRLPHEDELEAAFGSSLFPWGNSFPDGVPYDKMTSFTGHQKYSQSGLKYSDSTYTVELTRTAFKIGDGGEAVCGGYPWPVPWLSFSPSWRLTQADVEDCLLEFLEDVEIRPVLR